MRRMRIGIMGAMPEETEEIQHLLKGEIKTTRLGQREYHEGLLGGNEEWEGVVVFSRWGKVAAATTATTLISQFGVDAILFAGVGGAVSPALKIGDIVLAQKLIHHDLDISALSGFDRFEIPGLGMKYIPVPASHEGLQNVVENFLKGENFQKKLQGILAEFGIRSPQVHTGVIASGDQFIADARIIHQLTREIEGLLSIDMESAAIGQVGFEHGIPVWVTRIISDLADHSAPVDFYRFVSEVSRPIVAGLVETLLPVLAVEIAKQGK